MNDFDSSQIRYKFGKNWASFSESIVNQSLENATKNLEGLVGIIQGKRFLDIGSGSGSGIHSLAAIKMGAGFIEAVDYDKDSVTTTKKVLNEHTSNNNWSAHFGDIVNMDGIKDEKYDIVYSWGVLHHTGDMWKSIDNALRLVDDNGRFVVALYIKTHLCWFWKIEKYYYSKYALLRPFIKYPFSFLLLIAMAVKNMQLPGKIIDDYVEKRGMSFYHDIDDWLGGYPYESVKPDEIVSHIESREFRLVKNNCKTPKMGIFGSGCGEWVFERV